MSRGTLIAMLESALVLEVDGGHTRRAHISWPISILFLESEDMWDWSYEGGRDGSGVVDKPKLR